VLILGLDPGSRHTGWGVIRSVGASARAVAWGRISPPAGLPLPVRLREIASGLEAVLAEHRPETAAVERVFHGENSRSLIVLAETRGALLLTLARGGLDAVEIAPAMVKSAVAGSGRASKEQVARMVRLQLGLGGESIPVDATDALAVALAGGQAAGMSRVLGR